MKQASEPVLFRVHLTDASGRQFADILAHSTDDAVAKLRAARPDEALAISKIKRVRS